MTTKQTIKAWKNAEFTANNSPVGTTQVDTSILAQVQGGQNNIVYTGCIPELFNLIINSAMTLETYALLFLISLEANK